MLQYLVVLLDETSVSYCHYENSKKKHKLISIEDLKSAILFGMKENLMIQFIYPDYQLPEDYKNAIESIDHSKIMSSKAPEIKDADVIVFNSWNDFLKAEFNNENQKAYVLKTNKKDLFENASKLNPIFEKIKRLNVVINDINSFKDIDFEQYKTILSDWSTSLKNAYAKGLTPQFNLLTDRIMLDKMNNCNAGTENITIAPNGRFYICPAFYYDDENDSVGDLVNGLNIKNKQLLHLDHAPICRICDAYQCKRCIWLNRRTTLEVNTPSHEQCVVAHLERNASRDLLFEIRKIGEFMPEKEIKEIDYLDPFDVVNHWK